MRRTPTTCRCHACPRPVCCLDPVCDRCVEDEIRSSYSWLDFGFFLVMSLQEGER